MWRERMQKLKTREGRAAALTALRAWSKTHPKKAGVAAVAGLLALGWVYDNYLSPTVQIIDGATGRPLDGVYVIAKWSGSVPMPPESRTGCYRIRVTRTDDDGRYRMPSWSWAIGALISQGKGRRVIVYHPGYFEALSQPERQEDQIVLWPDTRSVQDRLMAIRQDQTSAQCRPFEDAQQRRVLEPVYEAMWKEAESIAETPMHRISSDSVRWKYNILRFGEPEATRIERQFEGRKP